MSLSLTKIYNLSNNSYDLKIFYNLNKNNNYNYKENLPIENDNENLLTKKNKIAILNVYSNGNFNKFFILILKIKKN